MLNYLFAYRLLPLTGSSIMHEHTKKQLSTATNSARRRSEGVSPDPSNASVNSADS